MNINKGEKMFITDKTLYAEMSEQEKNSNYASHRYGIVDDCRRCINCEIGVWNGWKRRCPDAE